MNVNEEAWIKACDAWDEVSNMVGFETRKDAFIQGFYIAYNRLKPIEQNVELHKNLYPKYNCPKCGDWFHMPYKYCKCDEKESER
jgi:hypothetical protein